MSSASGSGVSDTISSSAVQLMLPKLALFINVVCLLTVSLLKSVSSITLYNKCSNQNIAISSKGRVYISTDEYLPKYQNLTIKSSDFSGKLTIFAEESQRYLCFNKRWKLVGMTAFTPKFCQFYEESLENGYSKFRSARSHGIDPEDPSQFRYIGFSKKGKPINYSRNRRLKSSQMDCIEFLKLSPKSTVDDHNKKKTGQNADISSILSNPKINLAAPPLSISPSNLHAQYVPPNRMSNKTKIRHKFHHRQNFNSIT